MVTVGFTGNRGGLSNSQKTGICEILDKYSEITVLHGDCVGADTDFHKLCVEYRKSHPEKTIAIGIHPPNNPALRGFNVGDKTAPEKPYLERNLDIVMGSDLLIACPVDKTKEELRSGTWSTVRQARKRSVPVYLL